MAKSNSSASSIPALPFFVIYLINGAQFATCVTWCPIIVILPITKM